MLDIAIKIVGSIFFIILCKEIFEIIVDHIISDTRNQPSFTTDREHTNEIKKKYGKYAAIFALCILLISQLRLYLSQDKYEFMFYQGVSAVIGENYNSSDWSNDYQHALANMDDWIDSKIDS